MPQMMAMGVVCLHEPEQVTDDVEISNLIEDLAEEGLMAMELLLKKDGVSSFPWNLADWIASPPVHSGPNL
jgi:hypothetical protein